MSIVPWILTLLFIMWAHTVSAATTYYVATTGSDSNTCTQAQSISTPKQTIEAGITCLADNSGDTLIVRDGTYNEVITPRPGSGRLPHGSNMSNIVTIKSENRYGAVIQGLVIQLNFDGSAPSYTTYDGFTIRPCNGCTTVARVAGDMVNTITYVTLQNNDMGNPNHYTAGNLAHIISISLYTDNVHVINNLIHDAWQDHAFDPTTTSAYGCYCNGKHMLFDGNTFYDNTGYALNLYQSNADVSDVIVRNNVFYNNGFNDWVRAVTLGVIAAQGGNNQFYNNVFYNNTTFGSGPAIDISNAGNNQVYNNTFYNNPSAAAIKIQTTNNMVKNNLLVANGNSNQIQDISGGSNTITSNLSTASPGFVSAGTGDFHLNAGSPAIDTGATLTLFTVDKDGKVRGSPSNGTGTAWDIGAFERSSTAPPAVATALRFQQQPASTNQNGAIAVTVQIIDQYGVFFPTGTNSVTVAIGANPGSGTLAGVPTHNAIAGIATFSGLSINNAGIGYTLVASASGLTPTTSLSFDITSGTGDVVNGLVGCWDFEEGVGVATRDCSGLGNTGTLTNGPQWTAGLSRPRGLFFNGIAGYVNVGTPSVLNNLPQKTVAALIKLNGYGGSGLGRIVDKRSSTGWSFLVDNWDVSQGLAYNHDWSNSASWAVSMVLSLGMQHCVMVTYDRTSTGNAPLFYVDKVQYLSMALTAPTGAVASDAASPLRIGDTGVGNRVINGTVNKVRVWNRLLPAVDRNKYCDEQVGAPKIDMIRMVK